jgi:hypothetical protein
MKAFTKFAAAAALSLSMAGAASATTFVDVATSTSTGLDVTYDSATKTLTVSNLAAELNFDDALVPGANLQAILTLTGNT